MKKDKSYYAIHQDLLKEIVLEGQREFSSLRLFPATNGMFYTKRGTPIMIGTKGMPDLFGFIWMFAIFVEVKSGKTGIKKGSAQDKFRNLCNKYNVIHIEATSPKQFVETLRGILNDFRNSNSYKDDF